MIGETNKSYYNSSPDLADRYYWVIRNRNGCIQKAYYNAPASVPDARGLSGKEFSLFPNPNSGTFVFELPAGSENFSGCMVTNTLGEAVFVSIEHVSGKQFKAQLTDSRPGVYFARVGTDKGVFTARFLEIPCTKCTPAVGVTSQ